MTATKTATRKAPAAKAAKPAPAKAPEKKPTSRQLAEEAVAIWAKENNTALTLLDHQAGNVATGQVWTVLSQDGQIRRGLFSNVKGHLRITGFEDHPKSAKKTPAAATAGLTAALSTNLQAQGK